MQFVEIKESFMVKSLFGAAYKEKREFLILTGKKKLMSVNNFNGFMIIKSHFGAIFGTNLSLYLLV